MPRGARLFNTRKMEQQRYFRKLKRDPVRLEHRRQVKAAYQRKRREQLRDEMLGLFSHAATLPNIGETSKHCVTCGQVICWKQDHLADYKGWHHLKCRMLAA